jgi:hypothetical protein
MFTKRGCPFRCAFCTKGARIDGVTATGAAAWRHKSARASAREFLELADRFGAGHITITDDLFTGRDPRTHEWVGEFASELIDAGNRTSFMIDTRADGVDHELFALLRRAGLRRVFVGVESGSDEVLVELNKRIGRHTAVRALETLGALQIEAVLGFMYFTPLASRRTSLENSTFLREIEAADFELHVQRTRIYPGTVLEEQLRRQTSWPAVYFEASFPIQRCLPCPAGLPTTCTGGRPRMPLNWLTRRALFLQFDAWRALLGPDSWLPRRAVVLESRNGAATWHLRLAGSGTHEPGGVVVDVPPSGCRRRSQRCCAYHPRADDGGVVTCRHATLVPGCSLRTPRLRRETQAFAG